MIKNGIDWKILALRIMGIKYFQYDCYTITDAIFWDNWL